MRRGDSRLRNCLQHHYKIIFDTEEEAISYVKTHYPNINTKVYLCPATRDHYHYFNKTRKNRKRRGLPI
jgi:hypothetical protein